MSKQGPTCDACGHLVSEHDDNGCTVELDSAWTASGCKPCGCSRRRNDPRNVRKLSQSEQDEIMRNAADVYIASPPTPATSEGPYRVEADTTLLTKEPIYKIFLGKKWIENFDIRGHADTWCSRLNLAHSSALASHSDAVRELVRAAKLSRSAISAVANEANWGFLKDADDALHSALSNPALRDAIKEVEEA